jgi:hypothetical protein
VWVLRQNSLKDTGILLNSLLAAVVVVLRGKTLDQTTWVWVFNSTRYVTLGQLLNHPVAVSLSVTRISP